MIKISHTVAAAVLVSMGSLGLFGGTALADSGTTKTIVEDRKSRITVRGEGSHSSAPDVMRLNVGVEVRRPTAGAAFAEARKVAAALTQVLVKAGIEAKDLRTNALSLGPEYENYPKVVGYRATQGVEALVRDIGSADRVVDAVGSMSEDVRLNGISFEVSDDGAALRAARDAAFVDARARAEQYAGLAGRELGRVVTITEEDVSRPVVLMAAAKFEDGGSISPGRQTITVNVQVVYQLN
ncbi:SIMPL domain-containing protein [Streptosporangium lutulentum]|uniref:Uncharacterized protein YggE n=1 Tax=Streptosporangium lutulentum TaxID=1461250 RepID=A0ABT9QGT8_9ACTN|nr:SIMPL domain-containing protein [Streptosporangium lutulentum]MDP9845269.1 uncharacterized protein YggE [Streptosporangium lutulentum]